MVRVRHEPGRARWWRLAAAWGGAWVSVYACGRAGHLGRRGAAGWVSPTSSLWPLPKAAALAPRLGPRAPLRAVDAEAPAKFANAVEVNVQVAPGLSVKVLEASVDWQEELIEEAVEADEDSVEVDPYGVALWPAAQVLAQAAAAHARADGKPVRVLELGAGCGLASLALAASGVDVVATDFRQLPLDLLVESARRQGLEHRLRTQLFDVRDHSVPLPEADLVIASDLLYEATTAAHVGRRIAEARERGSSVLVSDIGRPNRKVFLEELQRLRPQEGVDFACSGLAVQTKMPCLGEPAERKETRVHILELPPGPAAAAVSVESPSVLIRPPRHGHVL